jgi:delta 1-pyrroline-5-carboxylate dehydrogenase
VESFRNPEVKMFTNSLVNAQKLLANTAAIIRRMHLMQNQAFINGKWVGATSKQVFEVLDPATEKSIGTVPDMDDQDVQTAIDAAHTAFYGEWSNMTAKDRSGLLKVSFRH